MKTNIQQRFDFIIGNPPYIAYPDLKKTIREFVRDNFNTCKKGKFDYCYAFIEKSYDLLADNGTMVYIIPSNIFKNVFAAEIRSLIKNELELIIDYPNEKVFQNALVSPAIIKIIKGQTHSTLRYILCDSGVDKETVFDKSFLEKKWVFNVSNNVFGKKVGDYFRVSSSIATLLNEAFIIHDCTFDDKYCYFGETKLEKGIVKKAASPKSKKNSIDEYIIFPYYYDEENNVMIYTEQQMNTMFPLTMSYLNQFKDKLKKRAADKNAAWYGYGRSQALQNANKEMILISSVISNCTKAYMLSTEEIPYSGLYIIRIGEITLDRLLKHLNTNDFIKHIQNVGVCVNGQSRRITPDDIKNFIFETE